MSKRIQLSIADPCHENWDNMTAAEKGRFCGSCQKQVIDFTSMSDSQLAAFFKKPPTGSVCGRFYEDQLDRSIEIPKKRIPWVKYFFQFVLPAFLLSAKAAGQVKPKAKAVTKTAEDAPKNCSPLVGMLALETVERVQLTGDTTVYQPNRNSNNTVALSPAKLKPINQSANPVMIQGIVLDENDNPVPFASVMIKGTKMGTIASDAGVFKIEEPLSAREVTLEVSSVGYEQTEIAVDQETDLTKDLLIRLNLKMRDEVMVTTTTLGLIRRTTVSGFTTTVIGKTIDTLKKETTETKQNLPVPPNDSHSLSDINVPKIYPNPVQRSQVLHVEWKNEQSEKIQVMLVSLNGNLVFSQAKQFDKGLNRLAIEVDSRWAAGIYIVQVRNEKGAMIKNEKLLVQ